MLLKIESVKVTQPLLTIHSFIDRARRSFQPVDECAPTYIRSLSFKGHWIEEGGKMDYRQGGAPLAQIYRIEIRALPWESPDKALEVAFDGRWQKAEKHFNYSHIQIKEGDWAKITLKLHGVNIL